MTVSRVWDDDLVPTPEHSDEPRLSYVVARLERAMRHAINERVQPYDLTTLQYTTMSVLGRRGSLSNAQLARRSYMSPQAMSEVIEALEKRGLIERSRHPHHRRVYPAGPDRQGPQGARSVRNRGRRARGSRSPAASTRQAAVLA